MGTRDVRERISVGLLAGFPVVAAVQLAVVVVPVLLVLTALPGALALRLGAPLCVATVGLMGYATWRAVPPRRAEPAGVPVTRSDAPRLWAMIDDAAASTGVAAPTAVIVVAGASVALSESLTARRRDLHVGLPLLQAWDEPWLRSAVARALALSGPAHRGRLAVDRALPRISVRNPAGPAIRGWAQLYLRADEPARADRESRADRAAAAFAGVPVTVAMLRDAPALAGLQEIFHAEYLGPGWQAGYVPDDVFGGFLRVLAARADDFAALRASRAPAPARLAALENLKPGPNPAETNAGAEAAPGPEPAGTDPSAAAAPGRELVPDLPGLGLALQAVAFPPQGRAVVDWDTFFSAARTAEMEREAAAALAALSRAAGTPITTASEVLDLTADGRLHKAAEAVFGDLPADETADRVTELITLLFALAALRSGVARWRHSWTGAASLVAPDGSRLDLRNPAERATDPATVIAARDRLAVLGIDLTAGPAGPAAGRPEVVGGLVNLVVDGSRTDLLIVDTGLFLVPGLPRQRTGAAKGRLARFAAQDAAGRAEAVPGARFVPYADLAGAVRLRRRSWDLRLRDGGRLAVRTGLDSDELPGGWAALNDAVDFLARTR